MRNFIISCFYRTNMASKHLQPESEESELRIVLFGKTGVGKSASGNTILGSDEFKSELSPSSVTVKCERRTRTFNGQTLSIVDTPGLFHTGKNHKDVTKELQDCIIWLSPGPHVFLLVLKPDAFLRQDKNMLNVFQNIFPDAANYTIVLFTHDDEHQVNTFIENHKVLKEFIESCEAYHVFNNEVKDESQVTDLLQKINKIKKERNFYSNEMLKKAAMTLEEVMQLPQIKLASDPEEAARVYFSKIVDATVGKAHVSKIIDVIGGEALTLYEGLKLLDHYLSFVKKWVYDHMPPEAFQ